ncbi:hypothetical protein [Nocardia nova]|uniref:hypothetical protein n=1 Tax=Nocardia nova TaxID=37330 RepID=UPI000CE9C1B1|nr:hypothetical protein [Nocardia nova]PPI90599.1 hypothetical protein C5E46_32260 [Nocardia nova]
MTHTPTNLSAHAVGSGSGSHHFGVSLSVGNDAPTGPIVRRPGYAPPRPPDVDREGRRHLALGDIDPSPTLYDTLGESAPILLPRCDIGATEGGDVLARGFR